MPSFALRLIALCSFLAVLIPALAFPSSYCSPPGLYPVTIRAVGGAILLGGGIVFAMTLENTLLRAGGNNAFKSLYLASAGLSGIGAARCLSVIYPVNMPVSVLAFSCIAIIAGILWLRFYHAAAG